MSLFGRKKNDIEKWITSASDQQLADGYEKKRQQWIKDGYGGNGEKTSDMKKINDEINKRSAKKWEKDPRRNRDPNFRWTDANRWDKD